VPGAAAACPCLGGGSGTQTCAVNGTFGVCSCEANRTDSGAAGGDPAEAFTGAIRFDPTLNAETVTGSLPSGGDAGVAVTFDPTAPPTEVTPQTSMMIRVPFQGGAISAVQIGFGGNRYFRVPVGQTTGAATQGTVTIPALVGNFCGDLASVCHMIRCFEQVVTPEGVISGAVARTLVLNCTGGRDCGGNLVDGGAPMDAGPTSDASIAQDSAIAACNATVSGEGTLARQLDAGVLMRTFETGRSSGRVSLSWNNTDSVRFLIIQNGINIHDTGCVVNTGSTVVSYSGQGTRLQVGVNGTDCQPPGLFQDIFQWQYSIQCQ
jgi:hypothetical protein